MPQECKLPLKLEFQTLGDGQQIPSLGSLLFCSGRDPQREAQSWLQQQKLFDFQNSGAYCLLGLGAGFHLDLLLSETEISKIQVIELHPQLIHHWLCKNSKLKERVLFSTEIPHVSPIVLEFRPAWTGQEKQYHEFSQKLRTATASHLRIEAEKRGCWILSEALNAQTDNMELNIKDIANLFPIENQTEEARIWRTLREFVK